MGHPGLAVALLPRTDQIRHVHSDFGLGLVRKQQDFQPVGRHLVLGDAFHAGDFLETFGYSLSEADAGQSKIKGRAETGRTRIDFSKR